MEDAGGRRKELKEERREREGKDVGEGGLPVFGWYRFRVFSVVSISRSRMAPISRFRLVSISCSRLALISRFRLVSISSFRLALISSGEGGMREEGGGRREDSDEGGRSREEG